MQLKSVLIIVLLAILTLAVRSYKISDNFMFAEDQEDLALRVKAIAYDHQPTLISAKFSQLGFYLPPGYLYFLTPFFLILDFHPHAAIAAVLFLPVITTMAIFLSAQELADTLTGMLSGLIYILSPTANDWDRIFWNPNLVLPASALTILGLIKVFKSKSNGLAMIAVGLGLGLQSHPQIAGLFIIVAITLLVIHLKTSFKIKLFLPLMILGLFILPLVIFELRHGFIIFQAIIKANPSELRPYYFAFMLPFGAITIGLLLRSVAITKLGKLAAAAFLLAITINRVQTMSTQSDRQDGVKQKLSAIEWAVQKIDARESQPQIQFSGSSAGFHYLLWYIKHKYKINYPIGFHESWDTPLGSKIIIGDQPMGEQGKQFGSIIVNIEL